MYAFEEMIDLGLLEGQTWTSDAHRVVAQRILIGNGNIRCRNDLIDGVAKINAIPAEEIEKVTAADLKALGVYF